MPKLHVRVERFEGGEEDLVLDLVLLKLRHRPNTP